MRLAAGSLAALLVLTACSDAPAPHMSRATPSMLGGPSPASDPPPGTPMSRLERGVADKLTSTLRDQQLTVDYLACPAVAVGRVHQLTCEGWLDGVTAPVHVRLVRDERAWHFDAELGASVIATENLVRRLEAEGYRDVDCGGQRAYPSLVGIEIVCSVRQDGHRTYVVATVTTDGGQVQITDY